jgi:N-carbamoyl-L-amino-acid hydrolase
VNSFASHGDAEIRVDKDRLWQALKDMATVGPGVAGGNNRQALSYEDGAARTLFCQWCHAAGMETLVDQMGNIFAFRQGTDP